MKIVYLVMISLFLFGCSNEQTTAEEDVITLEEFQKAQDEAYNLGYADGVEAGKEELVEELELEPVEEQSQTTYVPSTGLTLFSDGMDWNTSTSLDKKDLLRSVPDILISERESYLNALDAFYNDVGNRLKTIEEAIQQIEGS